MKRFLIGAIALASLLLAAAAPITANAKGNVLLTFNSLVTSNGTGTPAIRGIPDDIFAQWYSDGASGTIDHKGVINGSIDVHNGFGVTPTVSLVLSCLVNGSPVNAPVPGFTYQGGNGVEDLAMTGAQANVPKKCTAPILLVVNQNSWWIAATSTS